MWNNGQGGTLCGNQGQGGGGHGRTANNREREGGQGRGGGNLEEILKALQLLLSIKGVEEENVEDKDMENFPQIHAGGRGHGGDPLGPCPSMETPFCPQVENSSMKYESPVNDPKQTAAMRSAHATIISLEHLVDNPSEERATGEYMVCIILSITNKGVQ